MGWEIIKNKEVDHRDDYPELGIAGALLVKQFAAAGIAAKALIDDSRPDYLCAHLCIEAEKSKLPTIQTELEKLFDDAGGAVKLGVRAPIYGVEGKLVIWLDGLPATLCKIAGGPG